MNREEWLTQLTDALRPEYEKAYAPLPKKIRVTCGWPSKGAFSQKARRVGECWNPKASKDATAEVFISPCVSDSLEVGAILVHELVHASGHYGHRAGFKHAALALGLEGPMRGTHAGAALKDRLNALIEKIGVYPHAVLDKSQSPHKKDGTRLIKVLCDACGYTVRITRKWLDVGLPVCPCSETMSEANGGEKE